MLFDSLQSRMDREELDILFRRYGVLVEQVVYRMTGNRERAQDVAQEVWLHLLVSGAEPRVGASIASWLRKVAVNKVIDKARRESRWAEVLELHEAELHTDRDSGAEEGIPRSLEVLGEMIQHLPRRQRQVVELRLLRGRSVEDTARALGIAQGTVKATLSQARKNLRRSHGDADNRS